MKLSARNQLRGAVADVDHGPVSTRVNIDLGGGQILTSSITTAAAKDLDLRAGDVVTAVIKASDVIIGK